MENRNQIILEIIDNFYEDLHTFGDDKFEFSNPKLLKSLASLFITQKCKDLSDNELMTAFADNGKLLDEWLAYLKAKLEISGNVIQ